MINNTLKSVKYSMEFQVKMRERQILTVPSKIVKIANVKYCFSNSVIRL